MQNTTAHNAADGGTQSILTNRWVVYGLATLCCCLWGAAYPGIKSGYALFGIMPDDIPSKLVFAGWRFFVAGLILVLIRRCSGASLRLGPGIVRGIITLGLTQTSLQYIFFYLGLAHTTGAKGAILNGTTTFFSVIIAHFLFRNEKLSAGRALGCIIGFAGVMLVNFNADLDFSFSLNGDGAVVLAAFIFAASSIFGKKLSQRMDAVVMAGMQLTLGGAVLTALGYAFGGNLGHISVASVSVLAFLIFLSCAAFSLWSLLLKHNEVAIVTVFNFLTPVSGAILSGLLLNENIWDWKLLMALALVCIGIYLVTTAGAKKTAGR